MSYPEVYPSNALGVAVAQEASFGQTPEASAWQMIAPKRDGFEHDGEVETIETGYLHDDMKRSANLVGRKSCKVSVPIAMRGGLFAAGDGVAAKLYAENECLLNSIACKVGSDTGAATVAGTSTTAVVAVDDIANFEVGSIAMIDPDGSGTIFARQITQIDSDTRTLRWKEELAVSIETGGQLYAGTHVLPAVEEDATIALQVNSIKKSQMLSRIYRGLMGNLQIKSDETGKELQLVFDLQGNDYIYTQDGSAIIDPENAYPSAGNRPKPLLALGSTCLIDGTAVSNAKFSFDLGNKLAETADQTAENGRGMWVLAERKPVISISVPYTIALENDYVQGRTVSFLYSVGNAANGFAISAHTCQIVECKQSEIDGLQARDLTLECLRPEGTLIDLNLPEVAITLFGRQVA